MAHAALDLVDEAKWQTGNLYVCYVRRGINVHASGSDRVPLHGSLSVLCMFPLRYLKTVDRFNDLTVTGFVTASRILYAYSIHHVQCPTHVHCTYSEPDIGHVCAYVRG